jgi:hypothetical protein
LHCGEWAPHEAFIGKVRYLANKELISFAKGALSSDTGLLSMRMFAQTLVVKRLAFRHEREVRLLFIPHENADAKDDLFPYPVDPHGLIDQVMIDPRLGLPEANALKQKIRAQTGFAGEIKRSLLYAPPPELTIPLLV